MSVTQEKQLHHALLTALLLQEIPTGTSASSALGGKAEQGYQFDFIANTPVEKIIQQENVAVDKITINTKKEAKNVKLTVQKYDILPANLKEPGGKLYRQWK